MGDIFSTLAKDANYEQLYQVTFYTSKHYQDQVG